MTRATKPMTVASNLPVTKAPRWLAALGLLVAAAMPALAQCPPSFASAINTPVGGQAWSVAVGDFNADGRPDLAVGQINLNRVSIHLGNGDGSFQAALGYSVGTTPRSVAVGDFNGDGLPDLAVANQSGGTGNLGNVSILLNNAPPFAGTFQAAVNYAAGSGPVFVAAGDFNGDGRPDLAVTNITSNNVSVLISNANGTFQTKVDYNVGASPVAVAARDLNGDGRLDLAVANAFNGSGGNSVSVLLGNANGTFQTRVNYSAGVSPQSVAVGDFNADGRPDLAVASSGNNGVVVLQGLGGATFSGPFSYNAGTNPVSVAVGDLNADGRPDIVAANPNNNNIFILPCNANGTFQAAVNFTAGSFPRDVAIGDFNSDGRPDLAVGNPNSSNFSVLLNTNLGFSAPIITQQPTSSIIQAGQNATITTTVNGLGGPIAYQWRKNGVPMVNGGNISGATTPTLSVTPAFGNDTASYDLQVTGGASCNGSTPAQVVTSTAAVLTVIDPCAGLQPSITQQPTSLAAESGSASVFTVAATSPAGGGALTYLWRKNGVSLSDGGAVSGAFTPTLTIAPASGDDNAAAFDCIVSNGCGSTRSDPAALAVSPDCPADFNADGGVDGSDVDAFFERWVTGC